MKTMRLKILAGMGLVVCVLCAGEVVAQESPRADVRPIVEYLIEPMDVEGDVRKSSKVEREKGKLIDVPRDFRQKIMDSTTVF